MSSEVVPPPAVMWAQRSNMVLVTVCLEDCKNPIINLEPNKLHFRGKGGTEMKDHEVVMEWFGEIDPESSKHFIRERNIELFIKKKGEGPYWPRLLKDKTKHHWLKIDFNKWKDEDDSDDEIGGGGGGGQDLEEMMRQMGGLGGGGLGDKPSLDDLGGESDSDDEDLPDLE